VRTGIPFNGPIRQDGKEHLIARHEPGVQLGPAGAETTTTGSDAAFTDQYRRHSKHNMRIGRARHTRVFCTINVLSCSFLSNSANCSSSAVSRDSNRCFDDSLVSDLQSTSARSILCFRSEISSATASMSVHQISDSMKRRDTDRHADHHRCAASVRVVEAACTSEQHQR